MHAGVNIRGLIRFSKIQSYYENDCFRNSVYIDGRGRNPHREPLAYCGGMAGGGYRPRRIHGNQLMPNSISSLAS
jgi:hypothetical protein